MNQNVIYIGLDVDDTLQQSHQQSEAKANREVI